jgi:transposase
MDRVSLEQLLREGHSLVEIGKVFDKDPSTVSYWLGKYDLQAVGSDKHSAKGGLDRAALEQLVEAGSSLADIAHTLERSKATVRHWLKRYGLRTHGTQGAPSRDGVKQARAEDLSQAVIVCPRHGAVEHIREARGYYRCRQCRIEAVVRRRRRVKQTLVAEAGGHCQLCHYSRCLAALEFHHLDPSAKAFAVSRRGAHSIVRLRTEARKCVLLCSNCHAEVEAGMVELS